MFLYDARNGVVDGVCGGEISHDPVSHAGIYQIGLDRLAHPGSHLAQICGVSCVCDIDAETFLALAGDSVDEPNVLWAQARMIVATVGAPARVDQAVAVALDSWVPGLSVPRAGKVCQGSLDEAGASGMFMATGNLSRS